MRVDHNIAYERRSFAFRAEDSAAGIIEGVVIPYNQSARISNFTEKFEPGSIQFSADGVIANRQHDRKAPLARTGGGGLTLTDGPRELRARIELSDTQDGRDVRTLVSRGVLRGLSAEFKVIRDTWKASERSISQAILRGLGVVDRPAYAGSKISELRANVPSLEFTELPFSRGEVRVAPSGSLELLFPLETDVITSALSASVIHVEIEALDDSLRAIADGKAALTILQGNTYERPLASSTNGGAQVRREGKKLIMTASKLFDNDYAREVVSQARDRVTLHAGVGIVDLESTTEPFTGVDGREWTRRTVKRGGLCEGRLRLTGGGKVSYSRRGPSGGRGRTGRTGRRELWPSL